MSSVFCAFNCSLLLDVQLAARDVEDTLRHVGLERAGSSYSVIYSVNVMHCFAVFIARYAVATRKMSDVRPLSHAGILSKQLYTYPQTFSPSGSYTIITML